MGTEYWLVKPNKEEIFYLGKHVQPFNTLAISAASADYLKHDYFHDFFIELLETNNGLIGTEYSYDDMREFAYQLYEWCDDKVYLSNDCCNDFELWKDYKETGSIIKFCEETPCHKVILEDFIGRLPDYKVYKFEDGTIDYDRTLEGLL